MRSFGVRVAALIAALLLLPSVPRADEGTLAAGWATYRDRFIGDDGRVHDTGNKDVTHTEGQGWAMLFAESFDDRATFDHVWDWTRGKLRRPDSALFAWRWDPHADNPVADTNNATDGDILIAWALTRAAKHWHAPKYRQQARPMLAEIRGKLIQRIGGGLVLLPGSAGFKGKDGAAIVNPSYYIYPAFREFARIDPSPLWARLRRAGLNLLAKARFGQWGLPTDWVTVGGNGEVEPAANLPPRFGFDAIRIPLYLIWGGEATTVRLAADLRFWNDFTGKPLPGWVDVIDGSVAPFPAPGGFQAVIELARCWHSPTPPQFPQIGDNDDYYSASLILLAGLASQATRH
ncbi:MAG TPA: glycosyl hydrolase family 8 [Stellaceae bacterium]|nr:glycosyl hydrolase family 8 [Stellaceae bacterium]